MIHVELPRDHGRLALRYNPVDDYGFIGLQKCVLIATSSSLMKKREECNITEKIKLSQLEELA